MAKFWCAVPPSSRILEPSRRNSERFSRWLVQDRRHRPHRCRWLSLRHRPQERAIKTSGGKFIAPQPIENSLKLNPGRNRGHHRRQAQVCLCHHLAQLRAPRKLGPRKQRRVLLARRARKYVRVQALYDEIVEDTNKNLARFEKLKRVLLVPKNLPRRMALLLRL